MKKAEVFKFDLVLPNVSANTLGLEDALYRSGCDDALLNVKNNTVYLSFDREASTFEAAVVSAIADVESSGIGAKGA